MWASIRLSGKSRKLLATNSIQVPFLAVTLLVAACGSHQATTVNVPSVVGLTQTAAATALTGAGLAVGALTQAGSVTVSAGSVISQDPAAGAAVAPGTAVALAVSTGEADQCAEETGVPPRPLWGEQPDRVVPFTTSAHDVSSLGKVVSCDPNKLGQYPRPEGGNPHPKGADLQNISTNFHVLQSLTMSASIGSKALAKLNKFKTDVNAPQGQEGVCACNDSTSSFCIPSADQTRGDCDVFCDIPGVLNCGGTLAWLPNDAFKSVTGAAKFAAKHLKLLDDMQSFTSSPVYTAISGVLSSASASIENVADITASLQCWTDLFTEGYHLGAFDEQRPDLHMCVGYYGHGAFAGIGEPGKFEIGGRYSSHNLSARHRAQMRSGGWGLTAFGKTLTILPNVEFNTQLDGYRFFDKCKPLGFSIGGDPVFNCPNGFGVWVNPGAPAPGTIDVDKIDMFSLVSRSDVKSLDSDNNGVVSGGELIVAGYQPFKYPDNAAGPYQWPRAAVPTSWEGQVASVVSAGINIDPHITPIEKILGTYILYPGVTFVPILTLKAGVEWDHEAYKLRSRLLGAINKNLGPGLSFNQTSFERPMHPMQAPDVTADTGVGAYVTPGVKAQLTVGIILSKYLELGISGFMGLELDIRPAAHGGLVDLGLELTDALNASNPPQGPCSPVLDTVTHTACSDRSFDAQEPNHSDPKSTYACSPADGVNSCCLKFTVQSAAEPPKQYAVCIDDWTGVTKEACACGQDLNACYAKVKDHVPSGARSKIEGWLQHQTLSSLTATWNASKTCQQCDEDKSCSTEWWGHTPQLPSLSDCSQHGYCVSGALGGASVTTYDVVEDACALTGGTFYRYQCVDEIATVVTRWEGPGCHPLNSGFPSACGCGGDSACASGETCDATTARCSTAPVTCACNPPGNADPAVACSADRICVDGACARPCGSGCPTGFVCGGSGACVPESGIPFAEQIVWRSGHPAPGPLHAVETYGLTDLTLKSILSSGVRVGATVKLLSKKYEFMLWKWAQAWDLGSTQKARYQPGLEASYLDECHGTVGTVTNHQPGTGNPLACSGGDGYVCRYPSVASSAWASYDQPNELIAQCKAAMPVDVEDPPAATPSDFSSSVADTIGFGLDVGTAAWNSNQVCVGEELLTDWAKNPPQWQGQCKYLGHTAGASPTFACQDIEAFSLQTWGCLDTTTGLGAQVKSFLQANGLASYLVSPSYLLATSPVVDLHALVVDPSAPAASAQFAVPVWAAATFPEQVMLRNFLYSVEQCYDAHFQSESICTCNTTADCQASSGEQCVDNQCQGTSGTLAVCPFVELAAAVQPHPCCGDGVVEKAADEQCDDGNIVSGDGCSSDCKNETGPAACCTPGGCADMDGSSAKQCTAKEGNLFYGQTCSDLKNCGHTRPGG